MKKETMQQGLPRDLTPAVAPSAPKLDKKGLEYKRDKHRQIVRGIFRDYEVKDGVLSFSFGPEFKGDKTETWHLKDGEQYDLPYGVAWHLNNRCSYPEFEHKPNEPFINGLNPYQNTGGARVARKVQRFGFHSIDFMDTEMAPAPSLFTVEQTL